jgi:uncharacterized protein DUF5659
MKGAAMSPPNPSRQRITDLNLAAFLLARGCKLIGVESGGSSRVAFLFEVPEAEILAFYSDETLVPPRKLLDALKNLKGITQQEGRR